MARFDKYIWAVRLFKTRSLAANMIKSGKILLNGEEVKTAKEVKVGDKFSVKRNTAVFSYEVIEVLEKRVGAKLVADYLRDITPIEEVEKYKAYQLAQSQYREMGYGKPTKKDRRKINKYLND